MSNAAPKVIRIVANAIIDVFVDDPVAGNAAGASSTDNLVIFVDCAFVMTNFCDARRVPSAQIGVTM